MKLNGIVTAIKQSKFPEFNFAYLEETDFQKEKLKKRYKIFGRLRWVCLGIALLIMVLPTTLFDVLPKTLSNIIVYSPLAFVIVSFVFGSLKTPKVGTWKYAGPIPIEKSSNIKVGEEVEMVIELNKPNKNEEPN